MYRIKVVTLATLLALGGLLMVSHAEALPLQGASAIGEATKQEDFRQDVRYVCRRLWRCSYYGCGWRRACYWAPGPYAYVYPYYYRPYWRPHRWDYRPRPRYYYRRW